MRQPNAPRADAPLVRALRKRLAEVGFSEDGIRDACGIGTSPDPWALAARQPFSDGSPFSTCVALFWSGTPVPAEQAYPLAVRELEPDHFLARLFPVGQAPQVVEVALAQLGPNGLTAVADIPKRRARQFANR